MRFKMDKHDPDNGGNAFDGKITLKYKGEETEFDVNDAESRQRLVDLAQKGTGAEKSWAEIKDVKKTMDAWNSDLEAARGDDAALDALRTKIETYIGRPLTKKEEKQIDYGEFEDDTTKALKAELQSIKDEFKAFQNNQKKQNETDQAEKIKAEADNVVKKYAKKDGYPKVTADELIEYGVEKGIYDWDAAYRDMNWQKIIEAESGKKPKKRDKAFSEGNDSFSSIVTDDAVNKFRKANQSDRNKIILEKMKSGGFSLVNE